MAIVFDGRGYARKLTEELKAKIASNGRKLKLVTILNPEDRGSVVYTNLKAKKAEELGIEFQKYQFSIYNFRAISNLIDELNNDRTVDGIMIQLPFGGDQEKELINLIDPKKDVDGLREDSLHIPATVRAVLEILAESLKLLVVSGKLSVVVVGAKGEVGRGLIKRLLVIGCKLSVDSKTYELEVEGMGREDFDEEKIKAADVVISCTGQVGLIRPDMVKEGVIVIDVGYPGGDFAPEVKERTAFYTPVPGGVGPVTVVMLFANLVKIN